MGLRRGDQVVVEARAAEFFEARVLSVAKGQARVLPSAGGEPRAVAVADAYPLSGKEARQRGSAFAICRLRERWLACRKDAPSARGQTFTTLEGVTFQPAEKDVLGPSASTELNLREAFKKAEKRLLFLNEANRAGNPEVPAAYRPSPRARVIVRRAGGFHSATVEAVGEHDVTIALPADGLRERVAVSDLLPEPPAPRQPARGDFVLVRPLSPSEPWPVARVVATAEREFRVIGPDGDERVVGLRDLLVLVRP